MKRTFAVFMRQGSRWNPDHPVRSQADWDSHARFMDALFDSGVVILAGPFADGRGSMVILEAASEDTARAIFQQDPWTQQDILVAGEIREWIIFLDARKKLKGS